MIHDNLIGSGCSRSDSGFFRCVLRFFLFRQRTQVVTTTSVGFAFRQLDRNAVFSAPRTTKRRVLHQRSMFNERLGTESTASIQTNERFQRLCVLFHVPKRRNSLTTHLDRWWFFVKYLYAIFVVHVTHCARKEICTCFRCCCCCFRCCHRSTAQQFADLFQRQLFAEGKMH